MIGQNNDKFWEDSIDAGSEIEHLKQQLRMDSDNLNRIMNGEELTDSSIETESLSSFMMEEHIHVPFYNHDILKRNASENDLHYEGAECILFKEGTVIRSLNSSVERGAPSSRGSSLSRNSVCGNILRMNHKYFELDDDERKSCISVDVTRGKKRKLSNFDY
jgi:hypothetical protein